MTSGDGYTSGEGEGASGASGSSRDSSLTHDARAAMFVGRRRVYAARHPDAAPRPPPKAYTDLDVSLESAGGCFATAAEPALSSFAREMLRATPPPNGHAAAPGGRGGRARAAAEAAAAATAAAAKGWPGRFVFGSGRRPAPKRAPTVPPPVPQIPSNSSECSPPPALPPWDKIRATWRGRARVVAEDVAYVLDARGDASMAALSRGAEGLEISAAKAELRIDPGAVELRAARLALAARGGLGDDGDGVDGRGDANGHDRDVSYSEAFDEGAVQLAVRRPPRGSRSGSSGEPSAETTPADKNITGSIHSPAKRRARPRRCSRSGVTSERTSRSPRRTRSSARGEKEAAEAEAEADAAARRARGVSTGPGTSADRNEHTHTETTPAQMSHTSRTSPLARWASGDFASKATSRRVFGARRATLETTPEATSLSIPGRSRRGSVGSRLSRALFPRSRDGGVRGGGGCRGGRRRHAHAHRRSPRASLASIVRSRFRVAAWRDSSRLENTRERRASQTETPARASTSERLRSRHHRRVRGKRARVAPRRGTRRSRARTHRASVRNTIPRGVYTRPEREPAEGPGDPVSSPRARLASSTAGAFPSGSGRARNRVGGGARPVTPAGGGDPRRRRRGRGVGFRRDVRRESANARRRRASERRFRGRGGAVSRRRGDAPRIRRRREESRRVAENRRRARRESRESRNRHRPGVGPGETRSVRVARRADEPPAATTKGDAAKSNTATKSKSASWLHVTVDAPGFSRRPRDATRWFVGRGTRTARR